MNATAKDSGGKREGDEEVRAELQKALLEGLRSEATDLVTRTVLATPACLSAALWAILESPLHRVAITSGPSDDTIAALFAMVPSAQRIFEASEAASRRIPTTEEVDTLPLEKLAPELAVQVVELGGLPSQPLPPHLLPLLRELMTCETGFRVVMGDYWAGVTRESLRLARPELSEIHLNEMTDAVVAAMETGEPEKLIAEIVAGAEER